MKLFAVIAGAGWLALDGIEAPIRLVAGDCLLLASGRPYQAASDLSLPPIDGTQLLATLGGSDAARFSEGSECLGIAGYFDIANEHAALLLSELPPVIHIDNEVDKQEIYWSLERLRREFERPRPGGFLIAQQLATVVLIQVLRTYLAAHHDTTPGWLFALADERIGRSLKAIHQNPSQRWTLTTLAQHVGMSRTGFAVHFKRTVGTAPMTYVTHWRMTLAKEQMLHSRDSFAVISAQVGYESESAFSTAFKRVVGCSPRDFVTSAFQKRAIKTTPTTAKPAPSNLNGVAERVASPSAPK